MAIEAEELDQFQLVLENSEELGQMICHSTEVERYLHCKEQLNIDLSARALQQKLMRQKTLVEECERFGHFHPNYNQAIEAWQKLQDEMDQHPVIAAFREAEKVLDELLFEVSQTIAHSVSESIKVPSHAIPVSGCASGKCNGGCS